VGARHDVYPTPIKGVPAGGGPQGQYTVAIDSRQDYPQNVDFFDLCFYILCRPLATRATLTPYYGRDKTGY
jgi:hypothetical protein